MTHKRPGRQEVSCRITTTSLGRSVFGLSLDEVSTDVWGDWIRVGSVRVAFGVDPIEARVGALRCTCVREPRTFRFGCDIWLQCGLDAANARSSLESNV